jgi:hypothetical protein
MESPVFDASGASVAGAGDVNGDGFADIVVGAPSATVDGETAAGQGFVVFGTGSGFAPSLDLALLDGANGFRLDGIDAYDGSGSAVAGAGDVNGDGFDDLIVGAQGAGPNGQNRAGEIYVVFGAAGGFAPSLDLASLDGTNGFRLDGIAAYDESGASVAGVGDVNGDAIDDLVLGAPGAMRNGGAFSGASYVLFGSAAAFEANIDLVDLDGSNGFRLDGAEPGDSSGFSVEGAGDVNGDGIGDLIVGAYVPIRAARATPARATWSSAPPAALHPSSILGRWTARTVSASPESTHTIKAECRSRAPATSTATASTT